PLGRGGVEEAAALDVDMAVAFPHTADEQPNLAIGQCKDIGGDGVGMCRLSPNAKPLRPGYDARRLCALLPPRIDGIGALVQRDRASHIVKLLGSVDVIFALRVVFGIEIDRVRMAEV